MGKDTAQQDANAVQRAKDGKTIIETSSPLTRLHYFDGKFLRADAFAIEQDYHRTQTRLANLAGGWGVVEGFALSAKGETLTIGAGLAITAQGNFVHANGEFGATLSELLALARPEPENGNQDFADCPEKKSVPLTESSGLGLYEITVGPAEDLCGNEAVYGKLCESACVSSSQHPYWREGVVLRLRPLSLQLPTSKAVVFSSVHLRNRVASAYFAAERGLTAAALSLSGLGNELWCQPARLTDRNEVAIGLLVREGNIIRVIDAWGSRRERMEAQARGYWQGRMAMRPWNVFLAQILQFQCQLAGAFDPTEVELKTPDDECENLRQLLDKTRKELEALQQKYAQSKESPAKANSKAKKKTEGMVAEEHSIPFAELYALSEELSAADIGQGGLPASRMLLKAGFAELPPAGYLPLMKSKQGLEAQLSRIFGEGVRLHYHAVREDEIAHLVEEAQHMERISLTRGLDDPARIEDVEIFVPDGEAFSQQQTAAGEWWQVDMAMEALSAFDIGAEVKLDPIKKAAPQEKSFRAESTAAAGFSNDATHEMHPLDETKQTEIALAFKNLARNLQTRNFSGLARTAHLNDSGYGLSLIVTLQVDDLIAKARELLKTYPEFDPNGEYAERINAFKGFALYLAGDLKADPLALALGQSTELSGELVFANAAMRVSGSLTALRDKPAPGGKTERIAQLDLVMHAKQGPGASLRASISLLRKGDARDGELLLDDEKHNPRSSPILFDWQASPRRALMLLSDEGAATHVGKAFVQAMKKTSHAEVEAEVSPGDQDGIGHSAGQAGAQEKQQERQLLRMDGLSSMPTLDSPLGSAAMNALILMAEQADDPSFLPRARRRLFPALDAAQSTGVRAVLDWVMFRRARTPLCASATCPEPVKAAFEVFQCWHITIADEAELKALQEALENRSVKQLARFAFQPVGVLRYRDENALAEETELRIEAMWRQANPGEQVVLARYWEQRPTTGQGWQNHARLRNMLEQIKEVTQPPERGDGAITRLELPPATLSDGALDGGFLVVTQQARAHRVLFLSYEQYAESRALLRKGDKAAWDSLMQSASQNQSPELLVRFEQGRITENMRQKLLEIDHSMSGGNGLAIAVRIDSAARQDLNTAKGEYDAISLATGALRGGPGDQGVRYVVANPELGGALSCTVLVYLPSARSGSYYYYVSPGYYMNTSSKTYYSQIDTRGAHYYMPYGDYQSAFGGKTVGGDML